MSSGPGQETGPAPADQAPQADPASRADPVPPAGVGVPDSQDRLWTPHRMPYIGGENKPTGSRPEDGCPFCRVPGLPDAEGLVVARGDLVFAVLNLYPYNSGHVLICPYRHVSEFDELTPGELGELGGLTRDAIRALKVVHGPAGFNLGLNQGAVAGAGIAAHLHQHVVPRWRGDANFMPVIARTTVLPQLLADTRDALAAAWPPPARTSGG